MNALKPSPISLAHSTNGKDVVLADAPFDKQVIPVGNVLESTGQILIPKIEWIEQEKRCADCNNPTHLLWRNKGFEEGYRICQGCAKRRGGSYFSAIRNFTT